MKTNEEWIDGRIMIPDLLRQAPAARSVLDRYGLRGCGGPLGPAESVEFFARAHDVPLPLLLGELQQAARGQAPTDGDSARPGWIDTIYRPFFTAGILATLTAGAVWGAYLLVRISLAGSFTSVGLHEVNAHGHAQIFGWVGLFVMGFAYQAFPRFKHADLAWPGLARASLWLLLAGLIGRSICEPLAAPGSWTAWGATASSVIEIVAVGLCAAVVVATLRGSGKPLVVYDYYALSALGWFMVQAVYEAVYLEATLRTEGRELISLVATWQGALRDIQIHGFALLMILGVSQRIFHHFYDLPIPGKKLAIAALVVINGAVLGEVLGLVLMCSAGPIWRGVWYLSVLALAAAVVALVRDWRIFGRAPGADRSLKFLRAAYVWLVLSLAMLVLFPVYQYGLLPWVAPESPAAVQGFSHAYYGATRHAITVGFVSLMIVGVASRVVPTLNGIDLQKLPGLWLPLLMLNFGCALRVVCQTLTDFADWAFLPAGVSGLFEVLGLLLWGAHLWRIMSGRFWRLAGAEATLAAGAPIEARHTVGEVLAQYPALLEVFLTFGFRPLANPLLRATLAPQVPISRACRLLGVNQNELLEALNRARQPQAVTGLWRRQIEICKGG
jgi:hypothetical protein